MNQTKPKEFANQSLSDNNSDTSKMNSKIPNVQNVHGNSVVLGQLPDDFLRLDAPDSSSSDNQPTNRSQIEIDQELATSLQQQYDSQAMAERVGSWNSSYQAYLSITFIEAHLVKNYGLMNMNLYVRIRIGNTIYETRTSNKGGKNPKWNETCRCYLPIGVNAIAIELYDDCLFTQDELIAWATYKVPENFIRFTLETPEHSFEEKIALSGKQGDGMEGELFIAVNSKPVTAETIRTYITTPIYTPQLYAPEMIVNGPPILTRPLIIHQSTISASNLLPPTRQQPEPIRDDLQTLVEMFPKIEIDVIKSVLQNERGNLERSITNLLELNSTT